MGGLSFQRHHLQGRIEGSVDKLRRSRQLIRKAQQAADPKKKIGPTSPSTPAAPVAVKRKRRILGG
ncbi:OLC1v1035857C1 [Oldenlandia corymbosa var. corymbosa]|uniref:OLC1v1035857C1 n=1 Tax=Oldenlandia corymbosa var. corymbosa TaxID=529605 RepID=A0AAV1CU02_OLDCO|nr:OLC1v1035857C1 [Oldenlandia corymbosa var. corymbosa]